MDRYFTIILVASAAFLSGCATSVYREAPVSTAPPALTLAQIKEMSAKGVSDETILNSLRATRGIYRLTSAEIIELQDAKVSQPVIDYLLSTPQLYPPPRVIYRYNYYPVAPYWHYDWHWDWHHDYHYGWGHHGFHH